MKYVIRLLNYRSGIYIYYSIYSYKAVYIIYFILFLLDNNLINSQAEIINKFIVDSVSKY